MNTTTDCHILREALRRAENALNFFINDEGECDVGALDEVREALGEEHPVKPEHPEARALNLYLDAIEQVGYTAVAVDNGGGRMATPTRAEVMGDALACDEANIYFAGSNGNHTWIWVVFGNSPSELICDFSHSKDPGFEEAITRVSESLETK